MYSSPIGLHFEVTDLCNNRCPHCYGSSWLQGGKRVRPSIDEVARRIAEYDLFDVVITGGEPLVLGIPGLSRLFGLFSSKNIQFSLNTNARLLTKDTCRDLVDSGLRSVLISLHSWEDEIHDDIVKVSNAAVETKAGIYNAIKNGLHVSVNQVISNRNIHTMYTTAKELEKMGVDHISLTRTLAPLDAEYQNEAIDIERYIDEYIKCKEQINISVSSLLPIPYCADSRIKDLPDKLHCSGGVTSAVISCYGDVRFCPHDTEVWGNILEEDLDAIWSRISKWRNDLLPEECMQCAFVIDCRGGCRVASKLCNGCYNSKDLWMQGPISNYQRVVSFDKFDPECTYILPSDLRWRKEQEAYLLLANKGQLLVNPDGLEFIRRLPQTFVPCEAFEGEDDNKKEVHYSFLQTLYNHGVLGRI